jgi:hypothetical protein
VVVHTSSLIYSLYIGGCILDRVLSLIMSKKMSLERDTIEFGVRYIVPSTTYDALVPNDLGMRNCMLLPHVSVIVAW